MLTFVQMLWGPVRAGCGASLWNSALANGSARGLSGAKIPSFMLAQTCQADVIRHRNCNRERFVRNITKEV